MPSPYASFIRRSLAVAVLSASMAPGGAWAHAMMHFSDPADGATLTASPRAVNLTFTEECRVTVIRLIDEAGKERQLRREGGRAAATSASATLAAPLTPGTYRVEWRALGDDGHVMSGTVRFAVNAGR